MSDAAINRGGDFLDKLLTQSGALVTLLFILLLIAIAAIVWLVRDRLRLKTNVDEVAIKIASDKMKEQEDICRKEIASLQKVHDNIVTSLTDSHNKDYKSLANEVVDLTRSCVSLQERLLTTLTGFRQDLQRLYDGNKETSDRTFTNNTEQVKALTTIASSLNFIPTLIESAVTKAMDKVMEAFRKEKKDV